MMGSNTEEEHPSERKDQINLENLTQNKSNQEFLDNLNSDHTWSHCHQRVELRRGETSRQRHGSLNSGELHAGREKI
jgi:hypothetical protein